MLAKAGESDRAIRVKMVRNLTSSTPLSHLLIKFRSQNIYLPESGRLARQAEDDTPCTLLSIDVVLHFQSINREGVELSALHTSNNMLHS